MNIQERRLEKGWSQEELARHSGLSTRTIQRIEGGQKAGLESLKCLAAVFETSISTLMQEQIMTNAAISAKSNVKTTFILEQIAKEESIEANDDDVRQQVAMMAAQSGRPVKKLVRELRDSNGFDDIRHRVTIGRTLDFLRSNASVTEAEAETESAEKDS